MVELEVLFLIFWKVITTESMSSAIGISIRVAKTWFTDMVEGQQRETSDWTNMVIYFGFAGPCTHKELSNQQKLEYILSPIPLQLILFHWLLLEYNFFNIENHFTYEFACYQLPTFFWLCEGNRANSAEIVRGSCNAEMVDQNNTARRLNPLLCKAIVNQPYSLLRHV